MRCFSLHPAEIAAAATLTSWTEALSVIHHCDVRSGLPFPEPQDEVAAKRQAQKDAKQKERESRRAAKLAMLKQKGMEKEAAKKKHKRTRERVKVEKNIKVKAEQEDKLSDFIHLHCNEVKGAKTDTTKLRQAFQVAYEFRVTAVTFKKMMLDRGFQISRQRLPRDSKLHQVFEGLEFYQ